MRHTPYFFLAFLLVLALGSSLVAGRSTMRLANFQEKVKTLQTREDKRSQKLATLQADLRQRNQQLAARAATFDEAENSMAEELAKLRHSRPEAASSLPETQPSSQ